MSLWIVAVAVLVVAGLGLMYRRARERSSLSALQGREALTDEEIYQRFYASTSLEKTSVIELWHEIAYTLHVPASLLHPTDRFGKDVGVYWITSERLDALGQAAQKRAKAAGMSIDLSSIATVDAYVKQFAAHI